MASGNQTRRVLIEVDTKNARGLKEIAENMGLLNKNTKSLSGNMQFLTNAFKGWLGFLGISQLTRMSDEMQNVSNRLKIITGSVEGAQQALTALAGVADRTNQSISTTGDTYARLALSLGKSGATTAEMMTLTESLINTFRLAGATTTETTNTIIQLSQAFASGELRGQELRSVMEQNAVLAQALRERFGSDIYKKAQAGLISVTEVMQVLANIQGKVNEEAKKLAPTFEQVLTKSMNTLAIKINEVNTQFELSAKFAVIMEFAISHLGDALIVFGGVIATLAVQRIPEMIKQIRILSAAMLAFASSNPLLLAFAAIATAGALVYNNWESLSRMMKLFRANIIELAASIEEYMLPLREKLSNILGTNMSKQFEQTKKSIDGLRASAKQIREEVAASDKASAGSGAPTAEDADKNMASLIAKLKSMAGTTEKVKKIKEILGELNQAFMSGAIDINTYNQKLIDFQLYKLNKEFKEGKMDIFKYHEGLRDLKIDEFERSLAAGAITLDQFNKYVGEEKFKVLKEQVDAGKISLAEYNSELLKLEDKVRPGNALQVGFQNYINSIGTLSTNIAKGVEQTFGHLETSFTDFIKTGKFNFRDFANSVLDDLNAIIVRSLIIRPLAQGILSGVSASAGGAGSVSGGSYTDFSGYAAKGMGFDNGIRKFAKGGIVDSPTAFTYGQGQRGLMGEAGTEAILPLQRAGNGDLGVAAQVTPVTVNIINQSGAEVSQSESSGPNGERQIDILISAKVREGLVTGKYDTAMKQAYGITRKGS